MRQQISGALASSGNVSMFVPNKPISLSHTLSLGYPNKNLPQEIKNWRKDNLSHLFRGLKDVLLSRVFNIPSRYGVLYLNKQTPNVPDSLLRELLEEFSNSYVSGVPFPYFFEE